MWVYAMPLTAPLNIVNDLSAWISERIFTKLEYYSCETIFLTLEFELDTWKWKWKNQNERNITI